ncbi:tetratricopeptide repeat protein [Symmachiella macrocystis]|nr:tetratricopeptide repeat protein [Symmachiella macrocystis]
MKNKTKLSLKKKVLFSFATCVLFFLSLELLLNVCGVQPTYYDDDPFVGYSSNSPLFVTSSIRDGAEMVTAANKLIYFNEQRFLKDKPKRTYRIFCLGGSTTYGRPYDHQTSFSKWLGEFLQAADPTRDWEVINVGGISYASYRITALMEELNRYTPDLYVVYTGHNEFLELRTYGQQLDAQQPLAGLSNLIGQTRTFALTERLLKSRGEKESGEYGQKQILPEEVAAILDKTVGPETYTRDEQLWQRTLKHFEFNLLRMEHLADKAGADIVFITAASNIRNFSPLKSEHRDDLLADEQAQWEILVHSANVSSSNERYAEALDALDKASDIDDRHAELHYQRGRLLDRLGKFDLARAAYQRAIDEDVCPLRAPSSFQDAVRQVADETDHRVIDFERLVQRWAKDGIPGDDLFLDHLHLTIDGHRRLAAELFQYLEDSGTVSPNASWSELSRQKIARRIEGEIDTAQQGKALRNLAQVLSWAGKHLEAKQLALQAIQLAGEDAHTNFVAGHMLYQSGELDQAAGFLQKAIELEPNHVLARLDLAEIHLQQDEFVQAKSVIEKAIQLDPERQQSYVILEKVLENEPSRNSAPAGL